MTKEQTILTAVGRRKTASARVRLTPAKETKLVVNGMEARDYLNTDNRELIMKSPLLVNDTIENYLIEAKVQGGGKNAQAEAIRHAVARALLNVSSDLRTPLKKAGFLKRDPRAKERKKPGLKKARKRPQWSKR
jgi:small subunit ribosomal protein S9